MAAFNLATIGKFKNLKMRKPAIILFFLAMILTVQGQTTNPVEWQFSAKKIADKTFEIHLTAEVATPWHIYSQHTPEGGPVPTQISFIKNPMITMDGDVKETGNLVKKHEDVFDVDVHYYDGKVEFIQVVQLKTNVKTNVSGSVKYMVCNDRECLPPVQKTFTVTLGGK